MSNRSDSDSSLSPEAGRKDRRGLPKPSGRVEVVPVTPNWARALREQHTKKLAEEAGVDQSPNPEEKR